MADGRRNNGGARPGSGRKPKSDEQQLIEKLGPLEAEAFKKFGAAIRNGDKWAIEMFFHYRYGKPTQRTEISGPDSGPFVVQGHRFILPGEEEE